ncbi:hypothetical protein [Anaerosalibacter bizertensis]|nr:hypothetical protein [Anaerosalibacter bizertensis]
MAKKKIKIRKKLMKLEVPGRKVWKYVNIRKDYWRVSNSPILSKIIIN